MASGLEAFYDAALAVAMERFRQGLPTWSFTAALGAFGAFVPFSYLRYPDGLPLAAMYAFVIEM